MGGKRAEEIKREGEEVRPGPSLTLRLLLQLMSTADREEEEIHLKGFKPERERLAM